MSLTVYDIDPGADKACHATVLGKLRDAGSVVKQTIHRRRDGSTFPVETSLKYVSLERDYVVAVSRNISDRQRAEEALRGSEDRYRDLVEHSEDLVCTHDLEGMLLSVNPAPARVLGYEVAELMEMPMRDLIAPESREQFDAYLERIKTTGADQGLLCVRNEDGRTQDLGIQQHAAHGRSGIAHCARDGARCYGTQAGGNSTAEIRTTLSSAV